MDWMDQSTKQLISHPPTRPWSDLLRQKNIENNDPSRLTTPVSQSDRLYNSVSRLVLIRRSCHSGLIYIGPILISNPYPFTALLELQH